MSLSMWWTWWTRVLCSVYCRAGLPSSVSDRRGVRKVLLCHFQVCQSNVSVGLGNSFSSACIPLLEWHSILWDSCLFLSWLLFLDLLQGSIMFRYRLQALLPSLQSITLIDGDFFFSYSFCFLCFFMFYVFCCVLILVTNKATLLLLSYYQLKSVETIMLFF